MKGRDLVAAAIGWTAISLAPIAACTIGSHAAEAQSGTDYVEATPALIREIQFMLLRVGIDPGSIDGIVGPLTTRAVQRFQEKNGLPVTDLTNDRKVSVELLTRMRSEASRAILGTEKKQDVSPGAVAAPPTTAVTPAQPASPAPDRFAACTYSPADFRIGETQYTPDKFLQDGFDGSTARAVANLRDRLNEARQLAENIGGSALGEVQRQARVLNYFSCRLKIEQASDSKK